MYEEDNISNPNSPTSDNDLYPFLSVEEQRKQTMSEETLQKVYEQMLQERTDYELALKLHEGEVKREVLRKEELRKELENKTKSNIDKYLIRPSNPTLDQVNTLDETLKPSTVNPTKITNTSNPTNNLTNNPTNNESVNKQDKKQKHLFIIK